MHRRYFALCLLGAALAAVAVPVRAEQDAVQFFNNINITPEEPVKDAVCFFCNVHVEGNAEGDIVVFFGNVHLNGMAHHDVVDFFGNVTVADNSNIGGDLVSFFGSVRLGENVVVHKDTVAIFGKVHAPGSSSVGGDRVAISPWIFFAPLLFLILVIYLIVHEVQVRRSRRFAMNYPMPPRQ
jgi:hypothetical protein